MCESRKQFGLITYHPANNTSLSFWGSIMHIYWQLNTNFSTFRGSEQMREKKTNEVKKQNEISDLGSRNAAWSNRGFVCFSMQPRIHVRLISEV